MTRQSFQNISSTTLFNFTDTYDYLVENLLQGFYCGDVYEKLPFRNIGYKVPMVCFCDIPLGAIKHHLLWYGSYAIGIKREYARTYKVNPVWYIHKDNPLIQKMLKSKDKIELESTPILSYLKQFLGYQKDSDGIRKKKKFYDEMEWRYIPEGEDYKAVLIKGVHHSKAAIIEDKRLTRMPLEIDRIEYLIVRNNENKENLYKVLKKLSIDRNVSYEKLISSIITCTQIRKDF